jgi:hypothetical protein
MYGSVRNVHLRTAVDPAALALQVGRPSLSYTFIRLSPLLTSLT